MFSKISEQCFSSTAQGFRKLLHPLQFSQLVGFRFCAFSKFPKHNHISKTVKKNGVGSQSVPSTPSDFLIISLDIFRHVVVDNPAHIAFVNPHSESNCRYNNRRSVI